MIGDRHIFVVRAERVVRVAPAAAIARMMNAGEEIGELADHGRQVHRALRGRVQQPRGQRLDRGALGAVGGEQGGEPLAQREPRPGAERHQRVQRRSGRRFGRLRRSPENSPASSAARRSKTMSPIATPPRGAPPLPG